jgi:S1-C subfamily serine protease
MTENPKPPARPVVIAHTPEGPVVFAASPPREGIEQPPRRVRRRRLGLVAGAAALVLVVGAGTGTAAYALGQQQGQQAAAGASVAMLDAGAAGSAATVPSSVPEPPVAGSGSVPSWGSTPSWGSSASSSASAVTDAAAASAAQTVGVVTIVSDLAYEGAQAAGTGIVLTSDGLILTNNHVIEGSTAIEVTDELTGEAYPATVVGTDATHDIAVLQLDGAAALTTAALGDSDSVAVGDTVTAVGNAEGTGDLVAASGTVTALAQSITTQSESGAAGEALSGLLQIDADIVSGDSGGPLVNAAGEVVGIDTAASSGASDITGFAIPLSDALDIVAQIEAGVDTEDIEIGYPGFLGVALTDSSRQAFAGAVVAGVYDSTPAALAGLAAGDTITAVDGTAVTSATALTELLADAEPGETVQLDWLTASGTATSATVTLTEGPAA